MKEILEFVEDYVRQHGTTRISVLSDIIGLKRTILRSIIKSSDVLVLSGWRVRIRETVNSEFGEVTPEDLYTLRKYNVPTPEEIEERKEFVRRQFISSCSSTDSAEPNYFIDLAEAIIAFLTQLSSDRIERLACQICSEILDIGQNKYDIYVSVCGKNENSIKGWAVIVVKGDTKIATSGCVMRVSVPYIYTAIINRALKSIKPGSAVCIIGSRRGIDMINKQLCHYESRLTFSERETSMRLLLKLSLYNTKFMVSEDETLQRCRNMAMKARKAVLSRGIKNGKI